MRALGSRPAIALFALAVSALITLLRPPAAKVSLDWGVVPAHVFQLLLVAAPVWFVLMVARHLVRSRRVGAFVESDR